MSDNLKFGPDFVPNVKLQWLAIDKDKVETTVSRNVVVNEMLRQQVGDKTYEHFVQQIEASGKHVNDVEMIPYTHGSLNMSSKLIWLKKGLMAQYYG